MPNPVSVTASGVAIPHPEKVIANSTKGRNTQGFGYAGEDAYFLSRCMSSGVFGMGVADGVYMWRDVGIDSGVMSRALMDSCRLQVQTGESDVLKLLDNAVAGVQAAGIQGSTTLCVLTINLATGLLRSANLGDSGFIVLSPEPQTDPHLEGAYYIKFRCHQLEHSFGCPFQVGHHATADKVDDSEVMTFQVSPKDVVVMGTDGLLDNLGDAELVQEVASMMKQGLTSSQMAQRFTHMAFEASVDKRRTTPYSQCASEAFDMVYSGGKPDDITVLVAVCK